MAKNENNNWENDPPENEKLKDLVRDLAHAINSVFADSTEIKTVIKDIEEEGYQVDLVLASITRAMNKEKVASQPPALLNQSEQFPEELKYELSSFDQSFLKSIKINPEKSEKSKDDTTDTGDNNPKPENN